MKRNQPIDDATEFLLEPTSSAKAVSTVQTSEFRRYLSSIHFSRWQSFAGVCLYVSMAGTTYAFGIYSDLLKTNLGFSQGGLDVIASVGNTGLYMSLLGGMLLDRYGLHFVIYLGGFFIFTGFLYIWLAVEGYVPADISSVSVFFFLSQFGVCCHISSAVTMAIRLFPPEVRGSAVGLAKGYFGLSSAVLSDFSGGYFSNSKSYFILFVAIVIPIVGGVGVSLSNFIPHHALSFRFEKRRGVDTSLIPFFFHWMCLFTVLLAVGYTQYAYEYSGWSSLIMPSLLAVTVLSVMLIPDYYGERIISEEDWRTPHTDDDENDLSLSIAKQNVLLDDASPHMYFGSSAGGSGNVSSGSTDNDDDDARPSASASTSSLTNDDRKHVIKSLSDKGTLKESDNKIIIKNRRENGVIGYQGRFSYGTLSGNNESEVKNGYKHGSDVESALKSNISASIFPPIMGSAIGDQNGSNIDSRSKSGVVECFYGASIPLSQSVRTWRFWSLYVAFLTICGTGLMVIDNINAIAEAVGRHPSDFFVALVSLANGAGRVSAGFASDRLSAHLSKLQLLSVVATLMGFAQAMFAIGSSYLLYPSLLLVGYLFGCSVSLLAVNVADIFGPKFVSTNFGAVDSAPILGSYIFVTGIVALFYRVNSIVDDGTETCIGADCFRIPFTINSICCFTVSFVLLVMHIFTPMNKKIVSHDINGH